MKLSRIIKDFRHEHKMSLDELGKRSGRSRQYLSMLENERNTNGGKPIIPSIETLAGLANGMNMTLETLINLMDDDSVVSLVTRVDVNEKELSLLKKYRRLDDVGTATVDAVIDVQLKRLHE
mgnify:CR=1 FL=1